VGSLFGTMAEAAESLVAHLHETIPLNSSKFSSSHLRYGVVCLKVCKCHDGQDY
jgi:hypothetical protein